MIKQIISVIVLAWPALLWTCAASQQVEQTKSGTLPDAPRAQTRRGQSSSQPSVQIILVKKRSYCFPDLATNSIPLSAKQKFELFLNDSISGHAIAGSAASAGVEQAFNWYAAYGQGAAGYGKRFGASMARTASNSFFGTFLFATMLHQDPRFFVHNSPTFWRAVEYSLRRIVITRDDSGVEIVNSSGLLGPLAGEGLANTYLPAQNRTVGNTLTRYASDIGWRAGGNLLREYWPTLSKRLLPSKRSAQD